MAFSIYSAQGFPRTHFLLAYLHLNRAQRRRPNEICAKSRHIYSKFLFFFIKQISSSIICLNTTKSEMRIPVENMNGSVEFYR